MSRIHDGGAAFPRPGYYPDDPCDRMDPGDRADLGTSPREGMSLRDWFAGMALQGVLAAHADPETVLPKQTDAAEMAYQYADAMLAQQRKVVSSP